MKYLLAVLTHGGGDRLAQAAASFSAHAEPAPHRVLLLRDGSDVALSELVPFVATSDILSARTPKERIAAAALPEPSGFCVATRELWKRAASTDDVDYVFWLEHDFVLTRDVDLDLLSVALDANPSCAQMALMRDAVNETEKAAGGLYESRRGEYTARTLLAGGHNPVGNPWLQHRSYFTTNPSLMRRRFMADNAWPGYLDQCEGRFGIDLLEAGYYFGVWGDGRPWCQHVGVRDGFGY